MSTTLNLPPEVIAVGRLYMRELQRARRGYRLRPVGRPRKVIVESAAKITSDAEMFNELAAKYPPSADLIAELMESGSR